MPTDPEQERMSESIERAARLLYQCRFPEGGPMDNLEWRDAKATAQVLADAGLLAPEGMFEAWNVARKRPDGTFFDVGYGPLGFKSRDVAEDAFERESASADRPHLERFPVVLLCKHVTEWQEVTE